MTNVEDKIKHLKSEIQNLDDAKASVEKRIRELKELIEQKKKAEAKVAELRAQELELLASL